MRILTYHFFFFNDTATTEIYTLSLHDALPISNTGALALRETMLEKTGGAGFIGIAANIVSPGANDHPASFVAENVGGTCARSEEHTSELQSRQYLVCRLLLEKKKTKNYHTTIC